METVILATLLPVYYHQTSRNRDPSRNFVSPIELARFPPNLISEDHFHRLMSEFDNQNRC